MLSSIGIVGTSLCSNVKYCTYVIIDIANWLIFPKMVTFSPLLCILYIIVFFPCFLCQDTSPTHVLKSRKMLYFFQSIRCDNENEMAT